MTADNETPRPPEACGRCGLAHEQDFYDGAERCVSALRARVAELEADRRTMRHALERHGYRESCDIPACNCGDQWHHGGHAADRLREVCEVLGFNRLNGRIVKEAVERLVARDESAEAEIARLKSYINSLVGIIEHHVPNTHEAVCNGVHSDSGLCEGEVMLGRVLEDARAALAQPPQADGGSA